MDMLCTILAYMLRGSKRLNPALRIVRSVCVTSHCARTPFNVSTYVCYIHYVQLENYQFNRFVCTDVHICVRDMSTRVANIIKKKKVPTSDTVVDVSCFRPSFEKKKEEFYFNGRSYEK